MDFDFYWNKIIADLQSDARDFHTMPKSSKRSVKWFFVSSDGKCIYISEAREHKPSSNLKNIRRLVYQEFVKIFPLFLKRERGEKVSKEAGAVSHNQVYWYAIIKECCFSEGAVGSEIDGETKEKIRLQPVQMNAYKENISVLGYEFRFIQSLCPEYNSDGTIKKDYPQNRYENKEYLSLHKYGDGAFCKFSVESIRKSGVYLWVVENEIVYIGETENLQRRFNQGYGNISPRNCFVGGQSTNCKMNKVVLDLYEKGQKIDLYFYETLVQKQVEQELLKQIHTKFNTKNN